MRLKHRGHAGLTSRPFVKRYISSALDVIIICSRLVDGSRK